MSAHEGLTPEEQLARAQQELRMDDENSLQHTRSKRKFLLDGAKKRTHRVIFQVVRFKLPEKR